MVELIRRVMCVSCFFASYLHVNTYAICSPADIVGGDVLKLRRMDATVVCLAPVISNMLPNFLQHIFYEITGTAGAFASSSAISRFGNNYSFFMTPGTTRLTSLVDVCPLLLDYSFLRHRRLPLACY